MAPGPVRQPRRQYPRHGAREARHHGQHVNPLLCEHLSSKCKMYLMDFLKGEDLSINLKFGEVCHHHGRPGARDTLGHGHHQYQGHGGVGGDEGHKAGAERYSLLCGGGARGSLWAGGEINENAEEEDDGRNGEKNQVVDNLATKEGEIRGVGARDHEPGDQEAHPVAEAV